MKEFEVFQDLAALPVTTDACLFGSWVENQLSNYLSETPAAKILDIGTGTGLLSFMLAQKHHNCKIIGLDIHQPSITNANQSLAVNRQNYYKYYNVEFLNQDFIISKQFQKNEFNVIISNPPFFQNQLESSNKTRNIARHSNELTPELLISKSAELLKDNGQLFLLYPKSECNSIMNLLNKHFTVNQLVETKPTPSKNPNLVFIHAEKTALKNKFKSFEFCVYQEPGILSNNAISYLKDYYITL